ncbi:restriction endonuclease subunit S [Nostoc linckia FACHB-104]|nr:restriction endonuclease subunit S [Nostoc linckia FACHB-104]
MGEELYELPKGWVWASTDEICELITNGNTPKQADMNIGLGEIPYIKIHNLTKTGILDFSINPTFIPQTVHENILSKSKIFPGDVLMNVVGPPLGKVSLVPHDYPEWNTNQNVCIFRLSSSFHRKYLTYCLLSDEILNLVIKKATATAGQSFISLTNCRSLQIPIPPLPEQDRIVAKIEELFTQLDAGVELLKKVKAKLKRYRQAVLKAAVEGNLTKEWREANQGELEPASVLLERILKQRREKWEAEQLAKMKAQSKTPKDDNWKLKYKEPIAPDISDLPELPDSWCWASLEELSWDSRYGTAEKCDYNFSGSPVLRIPNIVNGSIVLDDLKYAANNNKLEAIEPLAYADLLVIRTNGSKELIGRAALVTQTYDIAYFFASYIIRFRLISIDRLPIWINKIWNTFRIRTWIETRAATSAGQHNISQTILNKLPLEIPPLAEQKKIIEEVERILSVIDQLEKTIDANLKRAEKLRQTILKQAFEGKLVPQDPNDEPAEKLLERIKAEKAKHEADKKPKRQSTIKPKQPRKSKTTATQLELKLDE